MAELTPREPRRAPSGGDRARPSVLVAVFLITLFGAGLRAIGLDAGLWIDEIYSLLDSFRQPLLTVLTVYPGDTQHPLYSLFGSLALHTLGEANWVIRLPAAIFGAATVPLLYWFGCQVTARREALLAATLLAVSYHHVWFSQNARGYTLLLFCAMLASHCLVRGLRERRAAWFAGYALAAALGAYTHLTMVFVVVGQAVLVAIVIAAEGWRARSAARDLGLAGQASAQRASANRTPVRRTLAHATLGFAGAAVLTLAFYAPIVDQVMGFFLDTHSALAGVSTPSWAVGEAVRVLGAGFGGWAGVAVAGLVLVLGLVSYARSDAMAAGFFILPGVVTMAGALIARGTMYPRFFFPLAGFAILIVVRGVSEAVRLAVAAVPGLARAGLAERAATLLLAAAAAASAVPTIRSLGLPKQDFVGAARWIERHVPPEDRVVTVGVTNVPYRDYLPKPWTPLRARTPGQLAALRQDGRRTWIVYAFPRYIASSSRDIARAIREECGPVERFRGTLGGGDIMVCPFASPAPSEPAAAPSP